MVEGMDEEGWENTQRITGKAVNLKNDRLEDYIPRDRADKVDWNKTSEAM